MERLTGVIQSYAWGSHQAIPELLGTEPTGEPQAELWLGAHPSAPAAVGGRTLDDLIADDPEGTVGAVSVAEFGPRLPYLLKVIAAERPLSLQAHPSRAQAEAGFAREQAAGIPADAPHRTYRDSWPKPEVLCALMDSDALCGFRDPDASHAYFSRLGLGEIDSLVAPLGDQTRPAEDRLATVFERLLQLGSRADQLVQSLTSRASELGGSGGFHDFAVTARELAEHYPGDPGVLAALLMNRFSLGRYDALYLPPGNLHAYLRGGGVEIMANSDNVLRGGLTPKHVDVDELLRIVDFRPGFAGFLRPVEDEPGVWRYPTPTPEFTLWRLDAGPDPISLPALGSGRVVLVTEAGVALRSATAQLNLHRGQSAFVTAAEDVEVIGPGVAFVAGSGI